MKGKRFLAALIVVSAVGFSWLSASGQSGRPNEVEGPHGAIPGFPTNSCYVCHDIVPGATGRDAVLSPNEVCLGCHTDGPTFGAGNPSYQDRPNATPVGNHISHVTGSTRFTYGDFGALWPFLENEQEIECTTCHDPHRTFEPSDPDPSTYNIKYIRDHTDDYQVNTLYLVVRSPFKELKVIDNTGPTPVEVIKQIDQDIIYTQSGNFADGMGTLVAETDICEVCHTQTDHHQVDDTAPGGQSHFDGEDCRRCHTHTTGFAPSGEQPLTGPHATFGDPFCGACHDSTFFPGGLDNPAGLPSVLCATCHATDSIAQVHSHTVTGTTRFEYSMECTVCHDQHGWDITNIDGFDNLDYIKATINQRITVIDYDQPIPVEVDKTINSDIVFDSRDDFANGDASFSRDICATCHTLTNHHQNDGDAPGGQSHFDGEDCVTCHQHPEGFRAPGGLAGPALQGPHAAIPGFAAGDCLVCHGPYPTVAEVKANSTAVCLSCHSDTWTIVAATPEHTHASAITGTTRFDYDLDCAACHAPHGWQAEIQNAEGTENIKYVRANIDELITVVDKTVDPPTVVAKAIDSNVVFTGPGSFADGDLTYTEDLCNTCHTLTDHHQNDGDTPGGQSHFDGQDCTTCHQHLEGFRTPGGLTGPAVQGPHAAIPGFATGDCLVCHGVYPTVAEMKANSTTVCLSCHSDTWTIVAATPEHTHASAITGSTRFDYDVDCASCHAPHGWQAEIQNVEGTDNIKYVRANINELITVMDNTVNPPVEAAKAIDSNVVFTGPGSFADGDLTYTEDLCNTCHTLTDHHQNDGDAPGGQSHFDGQTCTTCHLHPEGFGGFGASDGPHPQAVTDCSTCHLGSAGESDLQSIHGNDCTLCHTVGIPATFLGPVGSWNQECTACHNPLAAETGFMDEPTKGHRCVVCHGEQRSTSDFTGIHNLHASEANCVVCHGFIPDTGVRIGSGNRDSCGLCHAGGQSGDIEKIHKKHTKKDLNKRNNKGLSCLECHGERPPVDVVFGPPVGNADVVCQICHSYKDEKPQKVHKKHIDMGLDCGSCHLDAFLQDDSAPMPPIDDGRRAMVDRNGSNECDLCHDNKSASTARVHTEHVANQSQWCYNCHLPTDGRPMGEQPPATKPAQSCVICHGSGQTYNDGVPFSIHETHSGNNKCYTCHQTMPQLFDWPKAWLGGVDE